MGEELVLSLLRHSYYGPFLIDMQISKTVSLVTVLQYCYESLRSGTLD